MTPRKVFPALALAVLSALAPVTTGPATSATAATTSVHTTDARVLAANPSNPLAGRPWGNYENNHDPLWEAWSQAGGENKNLLAQVTFRPRSRWYGPWIAPYQIQRVLREYITSSNHGNPNAEVQVALFGIKPWEGDVCKAAPTPAQQASYKTWINNAARAIGGNHVAVILQPDLPFSFCVPNHSLVPENLVLYATKTLSSLPNTTVYLDAGAADWQPVDKMVWLLRHCGVRLARGFALNATHDDSITHQVLYGTRINQGLTRAGLAAKHFVINTANNGQPFTEQQISSYRRVHMSPCRSATEQFCAKLGFPPTTYVTNPAVGLGPNVAALAGRQVDAYMWIGRPWMTQPQVQFSLQNTLDLARYRRYPNQ